MYTDFTSIKTADLRSWHLKSDTVRVGGKDIIMFTDGQYADLDPYLPYIYTPDNDWISIVEHYADMYKSQNLLCEYNDNYCKFNKKCSDVQVNYGNADFSVSVYDEFSRLHIRIKAEDLLISGDNVGDNSDTCYLAIFRGVLGYEHTYQLGNLMMKDYYVSYDMTPYDERNLDYIQVSIAPQKSEDVIGVQHY